MYIYLVCASISWCSKVKKKESLQFCLVKAYEWKLKTHENLVVLQDISGMFKAFLQDFHGKIKDIFMGYLPWKELWKFFVYLKVSWPMKYVSNDVQSYEILMKKPLHTNWVKGGIFMNF